MIFDFVEYVIMEWTPPHTVTVTVCVCVCVYVCMYVWIYRHVQHAGHDLVGLACQVLSEGALYLL